MTSGELLQTGNLPIRPERGWKVAYFLSDGYLNTC